MKLRLWQRMGFGIESRTDFDFLHDVLRERLPYYAYEDMQRLFPSASGKEQQRAQLLFRLANALHAKEVRRVGIVPPHRERVKALYRYAITQCQGSDKPILFVEGEAMLPPLHHFSAAIVMDIDTVNRDLWQEILSMRSITYDMKNIGIALFPEGRYPEHYRI